MKLVADAKDWSKWWSIRLAALSGAFSAVIAVYATVPADWLPAIPQALKTALALGAMGTAFGAGFARVIDQPKLRGE